MKCKKRRILCSLLAVTLAAGMECLTAGAVSAQNFKISGFFRQEAETASVPLQPVDKTKGVTYITTEGGAVEGINLNGNSVILKSGDSQSAGQQSLRIWIDKNKNGVVDAGDQPAKLPQVISGMVQEGLSTEYIIGTVPIYGVYRAIATEPVLITNEICGDMGAIDLYGVYEGKSGAITINNRDAKMGKVIAAYSSIVSGDIILSNTESDEDTDDITLRTHQLCAAQNSTVTGNVTMEQRNIPGGMITAVEGGTVTGNVILTVQFGENEGYHMKYHCDEVCASKNAEIKGRVALYQQGGSVSRAYAVKGGSVECDDPNEPAVLVELKSGRSGAQYYPEGVAGAVSNARVTAKAATAVRFSAKDHILEGNIYIVDASDVTATGLQAEAVVADVLGASQITYAKFCAIVSDEEKEIKGNVDVNININPETELETSTNEYNLVKGKVTVDGNVTGNIKNIDARNFYGIAREDEYGSETYTVVNGDFSMHMEACHVTENVYGVKNTFIAGNYEMTGDAKTIAWFVCPAERATIEKSALFEWYGSESRMDPMVHCRGFSESAAGMDYTIGGDLEVRIPAGNFMGVEVCSWRSVIKGDVTADMHNMTGNIRGIDSATVEGNVKLTLENAQVETPLERSDIFYGIYSSNIGGTVDISVTGGYWQYLYGVHNGDYNTDSYRIEGDCTVSFAKTAGINYSVYGTYYGSYGGDVAVAIREHNVLGAGENSSQICGIYEGTYEGIVDVTMEQIEVGDSIDTDVYGTRGAISAAKDLTVTMTDNYNMRSCCVLSGGEIGGNITINAANMDVRDTFYCVNNNSVSCGGDVECNIDAVTAGIQWQGIDMGSRCGGKIVMEVNACTSGGMARIISAPGIEPAKSIDITLNDCEFKWLDMMGFYAAEDSSIRINGGTYYSTGQLLSVRGENGAKVSMYLRDALVKPYFGEEVFHIRPRVEGDVVVEITVDDTCTIPENYDVEKEDTPYDSEGALAVSVGDRCYIWGNYPVTTQMLQGKAQVHLEDSSLELPEFTAGEIFMQQCNLTVPKGVTVTAEDKYEFKDTVMLLEGTLRGSSNLKKYETGISFFMNGGSIEDPVFYEEARKYYPVALKYNEEAVEDISYHFRTIDSRPELLFAEAGLRQSIMCTLKEGCELKGIAVRAADGSVLDIEQSVMGWGTTFSFEMAAQPVTVTIITDGDGIIVDKTVPDPVAVVGQQYTKESPLYDFESLVIYNDDTEGTVNYRLKDGEVLPEGLILDGSRLVGTPTVVNETGTKVVFVITGKSGSEAELTLNIIVSGNHVHEYGDWICDDEAGDHYAVCECGDIKRTEHSYGGYVSIGAYTHKQTCEDCKNEVTEAHAWDAGVVTQEPTQTAEGVRTYTCTVCQEMKTEAIAKLPTTEEPPTEEPPTEEPPTEEPTTEKSTTEEPTTERQIMEIPVIEEPTTGEPTILAPPIWTPTTEQPVTEKPTTEQPTEEEPKAGEPAGTEFKAGNVEFIVVDPAGLDPEDTDTSPAVEYMGSAKASAKKITIPDTITVNGVDYRVVSVAEEAFKDNEKITKVTIGKNVKTIASGAFENCKALKTVTFKKNSKVKTIAKEAFSECTALKKITIPKSVEKIEDSAFDGCNKLATVTFQSGSKLKMLGRKAFNGCSALKKITIPKQVTTIGASAFNGCKKLATLTIQSTKLKTVGKNAFKGIKSNAKIKVPSKKLAAYKKLLKGKGQSKKVKIIKK